MNGIEQNNSSNSPKIIPFSEAAYWRIGSVGHHEGEKCELEGGRSVAVSSNEDGHCIIEIDRASDDGEIVRLSFGLSREAATALAVLLSSHIK